MSRFGTTVHPSKFVRARTYAALYYARENRREKLVVPAGLGGLIKNTQSSFLGWYYPCSDASGGMADDSGNDLDLTGEFGTITYNQTGQSGKSILFASGAFIFRDTGDPTIPNLGFPTGEWTIMYMIKANSVDNNRGIFTMQTTGGTTTRILHRMELNGKAYLGYLTGAENDNFNDFGPNDSFEQDVWKHLALRLNLDNTIDFFVNGVKTTNIGQHTTADTDNDFTSFEWGKSSATPNGDYELQHIAGWTTALTDTEIAAIVTEAGL